MSEELQRKLIEWVENIGHLAYDQLPDFASQILSYTVWYYSIWMYVGLGLLSIVGLVFIPVLICCIVEKFKDDAFAALVALFSAMFFFTIMVGYNYSKIKKCEVAPKLVMIDYLRNK